RWVAGATPGAQADHVAPRPSMGVPRPPSDPRRLTLAMGFCYTRPGFDSLVLEIRVRVDHDCRLLSARRLHRDVCTGRRLGAQHRLLGVRPDGRPARDRGCLPAPRGHVPGPRAAAGPPTLHPCALAVRYPPPSPN